LLAGGTGWAGGGGGLSVRAGAGGSVGGSWLGGWRGRAGICRVFGSGAEVAGGRAARGGGAGRLVSRRARASWDVVGRGRGRPGGGALVAGQGVAFGWWVGRWWWAGGRELGDILLLVVCSYSDDLGSYACFFSDCARSGAVGGRRCVPSGGWVCALGPFSGSCPASPHHIVVFELRHSEEQVERLFIGSRPRSPTSRTTRHSSTRSTRPTSHSRRQVLPTDPERSSPMPATPPRRTSPPSTQTIPTPTWPFAT